MKMHSYAFKKAPLAAQEELFVVYLFS